MSTYTIVMVRHGESEWNKDNKFCGWFDSALSWAGLEEARAAGVAIKDAGFTFDVAHTSLLTRAQATLAVVLNEIGQPDLPVHQTWRLNERHYGGLTGLNKAETAAKYGKEQVKIWRRSFDVPPPAMQTDHPYYESIRKDERYKGGPSKAEFPNYESMKLAFERAMPYWNDVIVPQMKADKRILIVAHGTTLRGIVKHIGSMTNERSMACNLPNGIPFVYQLDEHLKPVVSLRFLGNEETVNKAMESAGAAKGRAG